MDLTDGLAEHVAENRRMWDGDAENWVAGGERNAPFRLAGGGR
jgi:hypothetical protein